MIERAVNYGTDTYCPPALNEPYPVDSARVQAQDNSIDIRSASDSSDDTYIVPELQGYDLQIENRPFASATEHIQRLRASAAAGRFFMCRSVKQRGVSYIVTSHFSQETTITERIGNILSDIVSTSDYYRTDAE